MSVVCAQCHVSVIAVLRIFIENVLGNGDRTENRTHSSKTLGK